MVMSAQSGNGAKIPFGLRKPQTTAEGLCFNLAQWVLLAIVVCIAIGLVGFAIRFARWGVTGAW